MFINPLMHTETKKLLDYFEKNLSGKSVYFRKY